MLVHYIRIKLKHSQEPKNRGLIVDIGPPEEGSSGFASGAFTCYSVLEDICRNRRLRIEMNVGRISGNANRFPPSIRLFSWRRPDEEETVYSTPFYYSIKG
jgi:hypothetical protein